MPRRAVREGVSGVVRAQIKIVNGAVADVIILSGPKVFHDEVTKAIRQYKCMAGNDEVVATQEFVFKLD
jgi:protein TonB